MSRFFKKQGFTLIELMVVIVIIGVLASLAIPRFTEASMKAKVQDGPKVLASYETSYLAAVAEYGTDEAGANMMFSMPKSNWYVYTSANSFQQLEAKGAKGVSITLTSKYKIAENGFARSSATNASATKLGKYIENFISAGQVDW